MLNATVIVRPLERGVRPHRITGSRAAACGSAGRYGKGYRGSAWRASSPLHLKGEWPHLEATTDPSALAVEFETVRAEHNGGRLSFSACRARPPLMSLS